MHISDKVYVKMARMFYNYGKKPVQLEISFSLKKKKVTKLSKAQYIKQTILKIPFSLN